MKHYREGKESKNCKDSKNSELRGDEGEKVE